MTDRPRKRPTAKQLQKAVDDWNAKHPGVGHRVRYWPGSLDGDYREGVTSSEAHVMDGHTAVVCLRAHGVVALANVDVMAHAGDDQ